MKKLNTTKKEWINLGYRVDVDVADGLSGICEMSDWMGEEEMKSNASLIADAGNTYQECETLPSELMKQRDSLYEFLAKLSLDIENDINATPTGDARNRLCDINIKIGIKLKSMQP